MENLSSPFKFLIKTRVLITLFLFSIFSPTQAANPLDVVINEIAWMGTEISYYDEWIEIYNNTELILDLNGWVLKAADKIPEINLTISIPSSDYYLLERTDDDTVSNIAANQIYKGALGNKGEILELYDNFGTLIDHVDCSSGWLAGDNVTKQTMERKDSLLVSDVNNWQTSQNPGGTPKAKNSSVTSTEPEPKSAQEFPLEPIPPTYPSGIVFNEILPFPEGPDAKNEWIEILNQNNFEVDLSGWKVSDGVGTINAYIFPQGTKIKAKEFLVLWRTETKITLNNDGDSLNLSWPNNNVVSEIIFEKAPREQSYNQVSSEWFWSTTLTPGETNSIAIPEIPEKKEGKEIREESFADSGDKSQIIESPEEKKKELATVGEQISKGSPVFLIALFLAVLSGIIILVVKKLITRKKIDFLGKMD